MITILYTPNNGAKVTEYSRKETYCYDVDSTLFVSNKFYSKNL